MCTYRTDAFDLCQKWAVVLGDHHVRARKSFFQTLIDLIGMIATKICETISVAITQIHGRGEEAQLSSGRISIISELSSLNFNSSVRA